MPAIVPFIPLIAGGIGAAATVVGAHEAASGNTQAAQTTSDASTKAAQLQADATQKALDFEKQVYQQKQGQVAPYIGYGQGALSTLGAGLGVRPVPQGPVPGTTPLMPPGTKTLGLPQSISGGNFSPNGPTIGTPQQLVANGGTGGPKPGQTGMVNGVPAVWDGKGWKAAAQQAASAFTASSIEPPFGTLPGDGTLSGRNTPGVPGMN